MLKCFDLNGLQGILWIYNLSVKIYYDFSRKFGECLAKAWRKKAFPWKLGGLNCGLAMSRFQEARWEGSPDSSGVEVSELADEGEQRPTS